MSAKKGRTAQVNFRVNAIKFKNLKKLVEISGLSFADYMNNVIDQIIEDNKHVFEEIWRDL